MGDVVRHGEGLPWVAGALSRVQVSVRSTESSGSSGAMLTTTLPTTDPETRERQGPLSRLAETLPV